MAKKKLSPLVQCMALFNQLDERDKNTLNDYIRSQVLIRPKSPAPVVEKKSKQKSEKQPSIRSIETGSENVSSAPQVICGICGNEEDFQDHFKPSPAFHEFESGKKKSAA